MGSIGISELRSNPQQVIAKVRATGEPLDIYVSDEPAGVCIAPSTFPKRFVTGADLLRLDSNDSLSSENRTDWIAEIQQQRASDTDYLTDPWNT